MIVCVHEVCAAEGHSRVFFVDTGLAVSVLQQEYAACIARAVMAPKREWCVDYLHSYEYEDGDELGRMQVGLPQRVEASVTLLIE